MDVDSIDPTRLVEDRLETVLESAWILVVYGDLNCHGHGIEMALLPGIHRDWALEPGERNPPEQGEGDEPRESEITPPAGQCRNHTESVVHTPDYEPSDWETGEYQITPTSCVSGIRGFH